MVHGNYYGIQYEIHLTKEIDYYDDLLPIWMDVRTRIDMYRINGYYKLIVIPYVDFSEQLDNNSLFKSYIRENDEHKKCWYEDQFRELKYFMVKKYEKILQAKTTLPEPITKEEFYQLSRENQKLEHKGMWNTTMTDEEWREHDRIYYESCKQLEVQRIIHDPEYFEEIKQLHRQLLEQVSFTEEQRERIQKVLSHQKLEGIISWHGLTLVDGTW